MAVRPRSRWSDRSSTAWIAYSPFAEIRTLSAQLTRFRSERFASPRGATAQLTRFRIERFASPCRAHGSAHTAALEEARGVAGEVGDHDVGARAANRRERLHHRALLVEPS